MAGSWVTQVFQTLTHSIIQYQKSKIVNVIAHLIKKAFKYWETVNLTPTDTSFPKWNSYLNIQILSLTTNILHSLSEAVC